MKNVQLSQMNGKLPRTDMEAYLSFRAIANPIRFQIVMLLSKKNNQSATEIYSQLCSASGDIKHHLKMLSDAGLIESMNREHTNWYRLDPEGIPQLRTWLDCIIADQRIVASA